MNHSWIFDYIWANGFRGWRVGSQGNGSPPLWPFRLYLEWNPAVEFRVPKDRGVRVTLRLIPDEPLASPLQMPGIGGLVDSAMARDVQYGGGPTRCVVVRNGRVICWGPGTSPVIAPPRGSSKWSGWHPPRVVRGVSTASDVVVEAGRTFLSSRLTEACALSKSGQVKCWGVSGRTATVPGLGDVVRLPAPGWALTADGRIHYWVVNRRLTRPAALPTITGAVDLAADVAVSDGRGTYGGGCAVLANRTVGCFFADDLTRGSAAPMIVPSVASALRVTSMSGDVRIPKRWDRVAGCALLSDRTVSCWGTTPGTFHATRKTGLVDVARLVEDSSLGEGCAFLNGGALRCWRGDSYFDVTAVPDIVDASDDMYVRSDGTVWFWPVWSRASTPEVLWAFYQNPWDPHFR